MANNNVFDMILPWKKGIRFMTKMGKIRALIQQSIAKNLTSVAKAHHEHL